MLDGKAYQTHFPDDPAYNGFPLAAALRRISSVALLEAFAALADDLRAILSESAASID
jgi:hypothetical protein